MRYRLLRVLLLPVVMCCIASFSEPAQAGDFLYVCVNDAVQVIDCSTDSIIKTIPAYNDFIASATFSPDGKRLYACGWHSIYVIDTTTNELVGTHNFSSDLNRVTIGSVEVSQDGAKLYMAVTVVKRKQNVPRLFVQPPQLVVYDLKRREILKSYEIPGAVSGVFAIRRDPDHLILLGLDVYKLNLRNGKVEKIMGCLNPDKGHEVINIILNNRNTSPGDNGIVVLPYYTTSETGRGMGYLIIDTNTGELKTVKGENIFFEYSARISPDKKYIYAVLDELIKIDAKTGKTIKYTTCERGTYTAVAVTPDGKKVYAGPYGADVTVYDAESLKPLGVIYLVGDGRASTLISR